MDHVLREAVEELPFRWYEPFLSPQSPPPNSYPTRRHQGLDIVPLHPDLGQSELSQRVNWVQANL